MAKTTKSSGGASKGSGWKPFVVMDSGSGSKGGKGGKGGKKK